MLSRGESQKARTRLNAIPARIAPPTKFKTGFQLPLETRCGEWRSCHTVPPSLRANGSREYAPDDRLREAIQRIVGLLRRFAPLRKRFAFVAGNDDSNLRRRPVCE